MLDIIIGNFKKYGLIFLTILLFISSVLLLLCATGTLNIAPYVSFVNLQCMCEDEKIKLNFLFEKETEEKEHLLSELDSVRKELKLAIIELEKSDDANFSLLAQRDSLIERQFLLEHALSLKDSTISHLNSVIDSINNKNAIPSISATDLAPYLKSIDSLNTLVDISTNVYITDIIVKRIDDTQIKIEFYLTGLDVLKKYYVSPFIINVKVLDEQKKEYIELVEKNPRDNKTKNISASVIVKFEKSQSDIYHDFCYFVNTQDKPFRRGIFNISSLNNYFNVQFFINGIDRPMSYYPTKLKRNK